ncbi:MAG: hypothetical protein NC409_13065 [Clostridium sp.]|nr:hypothetical protein [Clostridium sp.]
MGNLVEFFRMFFSYVLVLIVYAAVAGVGIFCGLTWNKKKTAKAAAEAAEQTGEGQNANH